MAPLLLYAALRIAAESMPPLDRVLVAAIVVYMVLAGGALLAATVLSVLQAIRWVLL